MDEVDAGADDPYAPSGRLRRAERARLRRGLVLMAVVSMSCVL